MNKMEAKIILSREKKYWCYSPGDIVEGKLIIKNPDKLYCSGIRVDLEVIVRVNFEEKVDGRYVMQTKLENELRPKIHMYVWPINWSWAQITGKLDDERQMCLPASKHIFPFSFYYPMNTLPGSFCTQYGSIQHQVVAYLKTPHGFHKLALQPIYFGDYLNLTFDPVALSPLRLERSKKSFVYSLVHPTSPMKRPLQFTLKVPQRGFLPGEYSPFTLSVINLTGKSLTRILFSFIQKITYHADKSKKTMASVLDLTETVEADSATETLWESGFFVPEGIKPSYKGTIEYQYYIKVQIFTKSSSTTPVLKGHAPIIIGSTRDPRGLGQNASTAISVGSRGNHRSSSSNGGTHGHRHGSGGGGGGGYRNRGRRTSLDLPGTSIDRLRSDSPCITEGSPPPSYSQLSSRAASLDNFLPLYEDAMHNSSSNYGNVNPHHQPLEQPSSSCYSCNRNKQPPQETSQQSTSSSSGGGVQHGISSSSS